MAIVTKLQAPVTGAGAAKSYEQQMDEERRKLEQQGRSFVDQLRQQAQGLTPSLAQSQLQAASKRNLAQTLAAAQTRPASASARRQVAMAPGTMGVDMAQQGRIGSIQERQLAQDMFAQQAAQQAAAERANMLGGFQIARTPADLRAQAAMDKYNADMQKWQAKKGAESQAYGALLSTGAALALSDKTKKTDIKSASKNANSFLDAIEQLSAPVDESSFTELLRQQAEMHKKLKKLEGK